MGVGGMGAACPLRRERLRYQTPHRHEQKSIKAVYMLSLRSKTHKSSLQRKGGYGLKGITTGCGESSEETCKGFE